MGLLRGRTRLLDGSFLTSRVFSGRSGVRSIQRGTIALASVNSNTATITAVDLNNAVIRFLGNTCNTAVADQSAFARVELTNATTVTAVINSNTGGATVTVSYEVIEYWPGTIKSIQRGTLAGAAGTATITAVNTARAVCYYLGYIVTVAGNSTANAVRVELTNATTVTVTTSGTGTVGYQVVEYY